MTDPERLLVQGSSFEQSLLSSGAKERPSAELVARMERGLGISNATVSAASTGIAAKVLATTAAGGLAIWGAVALSTPEPTGSPDPIAAQVVAGSVSFASERSPTDEQGDTEETLPLADESDDSATSDVPALKLKLYREASRGDTSRGDTPRGDAPRGEKTERATPHGAEALSEEVRLLDRVRGAIAQGEREQALRLLDSYQQRFPSGVLAPEAQKLRRSVKGL